MAIEQKCVGQGCQNRGEPQKGFDFYVCEACFEELDRCLKEEGRKAYAKHQDN